jgi:hypothetical protein
MQSQFRELAPELPFRHSAFRASALRRRIAIAKTKLISFRRFVNDNLRAALADNKRRLAFHFTSQESEKSGITQMKT